MELDGLLLPGVKYNAHEQCSLKLGAGHVMVSIFSDLNTRNYKKCWGLILGSLESGLNSWDPVLRSNLYIVLLIFIHHNSSSTWRNNMWWYEVL